MLNALLFIGGGGGGFLDLDGGGGGGTFFAPVAYVPPSPMDQLVFRDGMLPYEVAGEYDLSPKEPSGLLLLSCDESYPPST